MTRDEALQAMLEAWKESARQIGASRSEIETRIAAAKKAGNKADVAELQVSLAVCRAVEGDFSGAVHELKAATAAYRKMYREDEAQRTRYFTGKLRRLAGEDGLARADFLKVSPALEKLGRLGEAADAEVELGNIELAQSKGEDALHHFERALKLAARGGIAAGTGPRLEALKGLALAHQAQGEVDPALDAFTRMEQEALQAGEGTEAFHARRARAGLLGLARRDDEAEALWWECLELARGLGDTHAEAQCLGNLANSLAERRRDEEALKLAGEARHLALGLQDGATYLGGSVLISALQVRAGNPERAYAVLAEAGETLARLTGEPQQIDEILAPYLQALREKLGDEVFDRAAVAYQLARRPS